MASLFGQRRPSSQPGRGDVKLSCAQVLAGSKMPPGRGGAGRGWLWATGTDDVIASSSLAVSAQLLSWSQEEGQQRARGRYALES